MSSKRPAWHRELQDFIRDLGLIYCLNSKDLLPFFTATLCGQLALAGCTEEAVREALDMMFDEYKRIKTKMESENGQKKDISV